MAMKNLNLNFCKNMVLYLICKVNKYKKKKKTKQIIVLIS